MAHTHAMEIGVSVSFTSASVDAVVRVICPMIMPLLAESNTSFDPTTPSTLLRVGLVDQATLSLTSAHVIADVTTFRDGATKIFRVDHFTQRAALISIGRDEPTFGAVANQINTVTRCTVKQLHKWISYRT